MNINEMIINKLEDLDMSVHIHSDGLIELETWTKGEVNMIITLHDITCDKDLIIKMKEYRENFSIDEEIMIHRQDDKYRENFTIRESLADFEDYLEYIDLLIYEITKPRTYVVPVVYESWGTVEIETKNKEDLLSKLNHSDFVNNMSLPMEPEYIDDSYKIDFDSLV